MSGLKLYEIASHYQTLIDLIEEGEIDEQVLLDSLEGVEDSLESKLENIVKYMKALELEAEAFKAEEKRLAERRKTIENRHNSLKSYVFSTLTFLNVDKQKAGTFTVSRQKTPSSAEVVNEELIDPKYRTPQPDRIDKKALLADMKQGIAVKGAVLKDSEKHLRIR